jgi:hypothetical protein
VCWSYKERPHVEDEERTELEHEHRPVHIETQPWTEKPEVAEEEERELVTA